MASDPFVELRNKLEDLCIGNGVEGGAVSTPANLATTTEMVKGEILAAELLLLQGKKDVPGGVLGVAAAAPADSGGGAAAATASFARCRGYTGEEDAQAMLGTSRT